MNHIDSAVGVGRGVAPPSPPVTPLAVPHGARSVVLVLVLVSMRCGQSPEQSACVSCQSVAVLSAEATLTLHCERKSSIYDNLLENLFLTGSRKFTIKCRKFLYFTITFLAKSRQKSESPALVHAPTAAEIAWHVLRLLQRDGYVGGAGGGGLGGAPGGMHLSGSASCQSRLEAKPRPAPPRDTLHRLLIDS